MALSARDWDIVMRAPLFKAMGPKISRAMIADRSSRAYGRGETMFEEGDPADGFFCMIEGWAKLYRLREDGEEVVVAIFSTGETFAEVAMFLGGRYPASCEAVSPARILKIDAANLRRAVLEQPQLAFDMLAAASMRLRQLVDEIEQLKARSAPQRIADFFVKQANCAAGCGADRAALREGVHREPARHETGEFFPRARKARSIRRHCRGRKRQHQRRCEAGCIR